MKNVGTVRNLSTTPMSEFNNRRDVPDPDPAASHLAGWEEPNRRDVTQQDHRGATENG